MGKREVKIEIMVECPTCQGVGEIMIDNRPGHNQTCPTCHGSCVVGTGQYETITVDDD